MERTGAAGQQGAARRLWWMVAAKGGAVEGHCGHGAAG